MTHYATTNNTSYTSSYLSGNSLSHDHDSKYTTVRVAEAFLDPICGVPHCSSRVETCFKHTCPVCGVVKSSKLKVCPNCSSDGSAAAWGLSGVPFIPEGSLVRLHRKFETQHSALYQSLFDGVSAIEKLPLRHENMRSLMQESELHAAVDRHPNVIRTYGVCRRENGETSMVVEQLEGDLTERLGSMRQQESVKPEEWVPSLALYLVQVARGLRHIHQHGILHRDICANNVLTDGEVVKVSDFGLAKRADDFRPTGLPYPLTTAPEVLRNMEDTSIWTTKSDVWQFGLLICEVLSFGVNPLKEFNISVPALLAGLDQNWLPARPDLCPDALWRVAVMCLQQDPKRRPEMSSIVPLMEAVAAGAQTQ